MRIVLAAAWSAWAFGAEPAALPVVEAFFSPSGIEDKKAIYTGEMTTYVDKPTLGQYYAGAKTEIRQLELGDASARFAVTLSGRGRAQDWYVFLRREQEQWKISAVRTLALTGMIELVAAGLRELPSRSEQQEWSLKNSELTLATDAALKTWAESKMAALDSLHSLARAGKKAEADAAARKLYFSSWRSDPLGNLRFTIGGVTDNSVGFLCVPEGGKPPAVDPGDVIHLEKIAGCWYLFRTT